MSEQNEQTESAEVIECREAAVAAAHVVRESAPRQRGGATDLTILSLLVIDEHTRGEALTMQLHEANKKVLSLTMEKSALLGERDEARKALQETREQLAAVHAQQATEAVAKVKAPAP